MIVHKCKKCGNTITQESIDSKNSEVQKEQDQQEIDKDNPLYQIIQSTTDERVKEHFLELLRSQKFGPCQSCQQRTSLDDNTYAFNTDNPTQDISWPKDIYLKSDRYPHYILAYRKSFIIFIAGHFAWQEGFGAFSYAKSQIDNVIRYIQNQEEHHRKQSFREEYIEFLKAFGVEYDERYIFHNV